ncbi:MAG: PQQ-like beta-propeller repeat protein [Planctomycetota bacterium]|nr:PQQ-like beta-propeller repeat protein [Planctomycetota bacterium]
MTSPETPTRPDTRWWPLVLIIVAAVSTIAFYELNGGPDRQRIHMLTMAIALGAFLLASLWLLLLSRLPWRRRIGSAVVGGLFLAAFFAAFTIKGVDGDLFPILEWRWQAAPGLPVAVNGAKPTKALPGIRDFSQFFGPARDGNIKGLTLARDWQAAPPQLLWRRSVGAGWSGFAIAGNRAITQEQHGSDETVVCYDAATGDVQWVHSDKARYFTKLGGLGPRATPTVDGDLVFTQGSTGLVNCLDLKTGARVWQTNVSDGTQTTDPPWGTSCSPLVYGNLVLLQVGGDGRSLVAHDKKTGKRLWSGGDDAAHYSSPVLARLAGIEQVLLFSAGAVAAHSPQNGRVLWRYPWKAGHPHVCLPVILTGDRILVSSGYGTGAELLQIAKNDHGWTAERLWQSRRLKAKFANLVVRDGFVYGLDDGILTSVDIASGQRTWKRGRYGHGQLLLVDDVLLVTTEYGSVVLVEATPDKPRQLAELEVFDSKTWNPPALAGPYLFIRNDRAAACYRLALLD